MTGKSILIVDDNQVNLKLARILLQGAGFDTRTAVDADEALDVLQNFNPDLIFMDIQLPGIDGLELTRRLKARPATKDIPIVALTAYAMVGDEQKARDAGCDGYITIPIDTRTLSDTIARYFDAKDIDG